MLNLFNKILVALYSYKEEYNLTTFPREKY